MPAVFSRRRFVALLSMLGPALAGAVERSELNVPGRVILLRHAYAPGTGDPVGFNLGDCRSQRNLNADGRAQAVALGGQLRASGLERTTRVYTSPWCRCRETARLLGLSEPVVLDGLASFFENQAEAERIVGALREFLCAQRTDGAPMVLVTHQVNITALTGRVPAPGEGVLLRLNGTGNPEIAGVFRAPSDSSVKNP